MANTITLRQSDYKKIIHRISRLENMFTTLVQTLKSKPELTVNGFTPEFEQKVLDASKEPMENDRVWNGKGSFTAFVLQDTPTNP